MLKAGGPHPLPPPCPILPFRVRWRAAAHVGFLLFYGIYYSPTPGGRPGPHRRRPTHTQQRAWPAQTPACALAWVQYWCLSDGEVSSQDGVTEVFSELGALLS